jgi:hypothetical protein
MILVLIQGRAGFQKVPHGKIRCTLEALQMVVDAGLTVFIDSLCILEEDEIPDTFLNAALLLAVANENEIAGKWLLDHGADMDFRVQYWPNPERIRQSKTGWDIARETKPAEAVFERCRAALAEMDKYSRYKEFSMPLQLKMPWLRNQVMSLPFRKLTGDGKKKVKEAVE